MDVLPPVPLVPSITEVVLNPLCILFFCFLGGLGKLNPCLLPQDGIYMVRTSAISHNFWLACLVVGFNKVISSVLAIGSCLPEHVPVCALKEVLQG